MQKTKVVIINKQKKLPADSGLRSLIRKVCAAVLKQQQFGSGAEINVSLVDDETIHVLNRDFRNVDRPTDVLSFPLGEGGEYDVDLQTGLKQLGDIVISLEHAAAQAEEYGHSYEREVGYLTAHSMLHLMGYDHVNSDEEAKVMRSHEKDVMKMIGLER